MSRLRWGLLSTARILRRFVPALRASSRSELCAVASRDPARARATAEKYGVPRAHGSYEELLSDPEIDAVYLALPNHLHAEWTVRCAEAKKHVLCEKPLALSEAEAEAIMQAVERHGVHVSEAFVHLHHPQAHAILHALRDGRLGRVSLMRAGFGFLISDPGNIRLDPARGGGSLWDVGCYPVSAFIYLCGGPPLEVAAFQDVRGGVDQAFTGLLQFDGGVLAHFDCSFTAPLRENLEIAGELGTLVPHAPFRAGIDGAEPGFTLRLSGLGQPQHVKVPERDPFAAEVAAFEATVLDGAPPAVPLSFSRQVAATLAALYQAARTGRTVSVLPLGQH